MLARDWYYNERNRMGMDAPRMIRSLKTYTPANDPRDTYWIPLVAA